MPLEYPKQKYHKTKGTRIVKDLDEENALGAGWGSAADIEAQKEAERSKDEDDDEASEGSPMPRPTVTMPELTQPEVVAKDYQATTDDAAARAGKKGK